MLAAAQQARLCFDYTPQAVKKAVCGSGAAGKEQVQQMVAALLGLPEPPRPTTPPTPSPSRSATRAGRRCAGRSRPWARPPLPRPARCRDASRPSRRREPGCGLGHHRAGRHPGRAAESRVMIASVAGEVLARRADHVVIDAGGVGYSLAVSAETLKAVPAVGEAARLHAHLVARDDSISLYGFASDEERDLFLKLTSVSGVGQGRARGAIRRAVRELLIAIAAGDAKRFQVVPGIGKRTAERIIVELREKVAGEIDGGAGEISITAAGPDDFRGLAREGLLNLGYSLAEAEGLLDRASGETPEEIVQSALRAAAGAKAA